MDLQHTADSRRMLDRDPHPPTGGDDRAAPEYDGQDLAWRRSLADDTRRRIVNRAGAATAVGGDQAEPPF
jgi:hypothetical protein